MNELDLIIDLHVHNERQGPGSEACTRQAIAIGQLDAHQDLAVADIGCGMGSSSFTLSNALNARITAVDSSELFIERMRDRMVDHNQQRRISPIVGDMTSLPFSNEQFDVIWSEGAIYNMGFLAGLRAWRRFLRPDGVLAVSEITWTTSARPAEIDNHWQNEYPGITTLTENFAAVEQAGYQPLGVFFLPVCCWEEHYYKPLELGFDAFLDRHDRSASATRVIESERHEIALYREFSAWYSYAFYVMRRSDLAGG